MSVKDKKKKEKKRQEALQKYGEDISKRTKGVSKKEWLKSREQEKATGNLPTQIRARQAEAKKKQFISPLASNRTPLSPQERQQADNILQQLAPKSPFQTPTNASFAPRPQISEQEKFQADSIVAEMTQPKQSFMQKIGSFIGKSPVAQSIQQKSLKPVGKAIANSFTPNQSAQEGESTSDYVAKNMFQVAGLFGPSDLGTGAVSLSKEIAKSKSSDFIKSILKGKLKDETVERITPILTKSKDVKEIQGIIKGAEASTPVVQKKAIADLVVGKPKVTAKQTSTAPKLTPKPPKVESKVEVPNERQEALDYVKSKSVKFREPTAAGDNIIRHARELKDKMTQMVEDGVSENSPQFKQTLKAYEDALDQAQIERTKYRVADDLTTQAKKFNSAEEFVKAQRDKMLYHGTYKVDGEFAPKGTLYGSTKEGASTYGSGRIESFLPKEGKTLKIEKELMPKEWDKIIAQAKKDGYDFVEGVGTDFDGKKIPVKVSLDAEKNLITKSQLTDIWEKANTKFRLADEGDDLVTKAKKYKSAEELTSLNPTGGLLVDYTPEKRATIELGKNITTVAETLKKSPDETIMIYRGAPSSQKEIVAGDFVTTDKRLAQSYGDNVISKKVRLGDILDDIEEPDFGEETLFRPNADKEVAGRIYDVTQSEWYKNYTKYLVGNKDKFATVDDWVSSMKASGKTKSQLTDIWNKANKEKFRVKDDLAKVGIKITDEQEKQIIKLNKELFGDENIKITQQIFHPEGKKVLGSYRDGVIKIVKGEADIKDTYYHESFHKYLDVLTTADEQADLLLEARKISGKKDFAEVEEWLSESFIKYAKNREGVTGKLQAHFDNVLERIKSYFGNEDKIKKAYSELISGNKSVKTNLGGKQSKLQTVSIPKEESPHRQVNSSYIDNLAQNMQKVKQSKFASKVQTEIPTPLKNQQNQLSKTTYQVSKNVDVAERVKKIVDTNEDQALKLARQEDSVDANEAALQLVGKYIKEGQFEKASALTKEVSPRFTRQGQQIQILSQYGKITPAGAPKFLQHIIDDANVKLPTNKKLTLTPQDVKDVSKLAEEIQGLKEGTREYNIAVAKLMDRFASKVPATLGQKISTIQTMAQLLNPKTAIRNLIGNAALGGFENVSDVIATGVDKTLSKILFGGQRSVGLPSLKTQGKGAVEGFKLGLEDALKGIDTAGVGTQFDLPKKTFRGPILGTIEKALNIELRATDRAFYNSAYKGALESMKKVNKNITKEMEIAAGEEALYRTFQNSSGLSNMLSGLKKQLNRVGTPAGEFGLGDLILKYPKTPGNIVNVGIDYSPFGLIKVANNIQKVVRGIDIKNISNQRQISKGIARALTGTGLISTGYVLAKNGIITGQKDKDKDINQQLRETGQGPFKINIDALSRLTNGKDAKPKNGDTLVSYDWLQPSAIQFSMGANAAIGAKDTTDQINAVIDSVSSGVDTITQQPVISGVTNFFRTASQTGGAAGILKAGTQALAGAPASFVPSLFNQLAQLRDNTARATYDNSFIQQSINKVKARIPGLREGLQPQVGISGKDLEQYQNNTNSIFNVMFNPAFVSEINKDENAKMVLDIYERSGEKKQVPRMVAISQKVNGEDIKLDDKQINELQKFVGTLTTKAFEQLVKDKTFSTLTDEEKANQMSNIMTDIGKLGKVKILGDGGDYKEEGEILSDIKYHQTYRTIDTLFKAGKTSEAYQKIDTLKGEEKESFNRIKGNERPSWYKPKEVQENPQKQTFEKAYELQLQGKDQEADELVKNMTDDEFEDYKKARTAKRAANSTTMKARLEEDPKLAVEFVRSQPKKEQERLINLLTDEQYERYQTGK